MDDDSIDNSIDDGPEPELVVPVRVGIDENGYLFVPLVQHVVHPADAVLAFLDSLDVDALDEAMAGFGDFTTTAGACAIGVMRAIAVNGG